MGNMANEALARMREDGVDPSQTLGELDAAGGLAPGTGGDTPPQNQPPPAGESNTDTRAGDRGTPESIPYARFKEVNDQLAALKGYEQLRDYGYDPDSLGRLAAFDARFAEDPFGTVALVVDALDLPEDKKEAIVELLGASSDDTPPSGSGGEREDADDTSRLSPDDAEALEWARQARAREAESQQTEREQAFAAEVRGHWNDMDKDEQLPEVKEQTQLMYVSMAARMGGYRSTQELAEKARELYLEERESILGSVVSARGERTGSPRRVPSGGPPAPEPEKFPDLRAASKAAEADIKAGRLPSLGRIGG